VLPKQAPEVWSVMTDPRRILMTVDAVGGVWTYALDLAAGLRRHGIETVLAMLGPEPATHEIARATGCGAIVVATGLPLDWTAERAEELEAAACAVARLTADTAPDLVHLNSPALAGAVNFARPVLAAAHSCVATWWESVRSGPLPEDFRWRTEFLQRGYTRADAIVAPSRAFAAATTRRYGLTRPVHAVHNGRSPGTAEAGQGDLFVLTAGRLWDEGKNVATLDAAADRIVLPVRAAGPLMGPHGVCFTPGRLEALGSLSEQGLRQLLAARPIFVSPALYEPFGLAVLEAAQHGCPLVLSDIPTFRELWDGVALFAPARDAAALAGAVNGLAADEAARRSLGEAARKRAGRFTTEAMTDGILALYRSLKGRGAGSVKGAAA
jgi:glycosyltransferase involved in cell wall biosynthesis